MRCPDVDPLEAVIIEGGTGIEAHTSGVQNRLSRKRSCVQQMRA